MTPFNWKYKPIFLRCLLYCRIYNVAKMEIVLTFWKEILGGNILLKIFNLIISNVAASPVSGLKKFCEINLTRKQIYLWVMISDKSISFLPSCYYYNYSALYIFCVIK